MRENTVVPAIVGLVLGVTLFAGFALTRLAHAQERTAVATGARLFVEQGCYGCHRVGALGTPIGPDLSRVGARYTAPDLVRWLSDPASQKPNAHMPKLELTPADITALAAFLAAQR
jgi:cbb3-type cytochrome oxidase cytochrome c subunit